MKPMIELLRNGETCEAAPKCRMYSSPKINGDVFAVVRCGPVWEVRCWTYSGGRLTGNQLVCVFESEPGADAAARLLATKEGDEPTPRTEANAALIVKAVNRDHLFDELVRLLTKATAKGVSWCGGVDDDAAAAVLAKVVATKAHSAQIPAP